MITELNPPYAISFKEFEGPFYAKVRFTFAPTATGTQFHIAAEVDELPVEMRPLTQNAIAKQGIESIISHEQEQLKVMLENKMDLWTMIGYSGIQIVTYKKGAKTVKKYLKLVISEPF